MRVDELLGQYVTDRDGQRVGRVIELRTRLERRPDGAPVLVVSSCVVGRRQWRLFGYERAYERGPFLLRLLLRLLHRGTVVVPWDRVAERDGTGIRLTCARGDLERLIKEDPSI